MIPDILFSNIKHFLESFSGGAEEKQVICIPETSCIVVIDDAATARLLEELEEIVHVEAEQNRRNHCALTDTIPY